MGDRSRQGQYQFVDVMTSGEGAVATAFGNQVAYCRHADAPITARVVEGIWDAIASGLDNVLARRIREWQGAPLADALPLRIAGGIHALHLMGSEPRLAPIYCGSEADDASIIADAMRQHEEFLLPWLDGPPQTNEAGRSANFISALLWLASKGLPPSFECFEIGSSAGINLMLDRYSYDLAGVRIGPDTAVMHFAPLWHGSPPPDHGFQIVGTKGCDVAPVDLSDPAQALRLKAYIWPEHGVRFERMEAAIRAAEQHPPDLVRMNAADFVQRQLALPQAAGVTRVLMHSIVWQYVPQDQQEAVTAAMEAAGQRATAERPLAWVSVEADRTVHRHQLTVRHWPGDGETQRLAWSHPHGADIEWVGDQTEF